MTDRRQLPSVDRLLQDPAVQQLLSSHPRTSVVAAVREALEVARHHRAGVPQSWGQDIAERLHRRTAPSLRPVLNATGVVLHTNLGRAPLAESAAAAMQGVAQAYSTLEFDVASGTRGHRSDHCRVLLAELSGAEDGLVVNNAAAALVLTLNTVAAGSAVVISRGELIEIGGAFRIPDIIAKSGAVLREVGTTNRTRLQDYERALDGAAAILTVHRSNFEQRGFVESPEPSDLARLAHETRLPFIYDVGSGLLTDLEPWGLRGEPRVPDAVRSGADSVIFSGDKLLGGPQAGCVVGKASLMARYRDNPFARAFRADRFTLAGLEATLALYRSPEVALREIPVLAMLTLDRGTLVERARLLATHCSDELHPMVQDGESAVGGGAMPGARLPTALVALDPGSLGADGLALRLRLGTPPVIARVADGRVLLDPRTLPLSAFEDVGRATKRALED